MGDIRRLPRGVRHGGADSIPFCRCNASACAMSATAKRRRIQRHPLAAHLGRNAELIAKRDLLHDLDIAILRARLDAERTRMQIAHAGKGLQEDVMIGRIVRDHRHARHDFARRWRGSGRPGSRSFPENDAGRPQSATSGEAGSCAKASEKASFTGVPSGLVPRAQNRTPRSRRCRLPRTRAHHRSRRVLLRISIEKPFAARRESRG